MKKSYCSVKNKKDFERIHRPDLAVVGGGMAGVAAAVTGARLGLKTVLVQNRFCLGGPASIECDCDADGGLVCGASEWMTRDARETGVIEDMRLTGESLFVSGWRNYWSQMLRDLCEAESNLTLLLNTEVYDVETEGSRITKLTARTIGSDLTHFIYPETVIDSSGDSFVGFEAGAEFRMGREAKSEFNERLAPAESDECTLGSSLYFRAVDVGHPVPFVPPPWAYKFEDETPFVSRGHWDFKKGYWWLECGGDMNTIRDNEEIYRKLLAILYGIWDHIKNHGNHGAENYAINWIAGFPGKRESRRLIGDYILKESDILENRNFDDAVTYGGGNVDLHPIQGFFSGNTPAGPEHGILSPGLYQIPLRCLYSRNIDNLLMAGRNISASHVAFSSIRLMATCSAGGQAAAGAAFLMKKYGVPPREIDRKHIPELRRVLYRVDHTVPGVDIEDAANLCNGAKAAASSSMPLECREVDGREILSDKTPYSAQSFVAANNRIDSAFFRFDNPSADSKTVTAELVRQEKMYEFTTGEVLAKAEAEIGVGTAVEAEFRLRAEVEPGKRYYIRLTGTGGLSVCYARCYLPGVYKARKIAAGWPPKGDNRNLCCRFQPEQRPFEAENLLNTHNRGGDHLSVWISDPAKGFPQTAEIVFPEKKSCGCVELVFDTNLDAVNIYSLQEECVRDYRLEGVCDGKPVALAEVSGNFLRFRKHIFQPLMLDGLRLTVNASNGAPSARVYQIRAYAKGEIE
ncbi:MAG: FAD dependent oxidoreductase [Lentisphaerae bacterium ADurb.Bin242]|nr:MAG: FAD dependent oxidoreductase [Lentisphaerae bacterium ADurb.Bin242]